MPVRGLDHLAITVADVIATLRFYESVLGAKALYEQEYLRGDIPVALLEIGQSRISVHPAAKPASPHADAPTVGSADVCFRFDGPIADAMAMLTARGVDVIEGPVPRPAADGTLGQSVYFRDPDANLLELLTTDG